MSDKQNAQQKLLSQIELLLSPIMNASTNEAVRDQLFKNLGWDLKQLGNIPIVEINNILSTLSVSIQDVTDLIADPPKSIVDIASSLDVVGNLFTTLDSINSFFDSYSSTEVPNSLKTELSNLGEDIFNFVVTFYIENNLPKIYSTLVTLGLIDSNLFKQNTAPVLNSDGWFRKPNNFSKIRYDKITSLFTDPIQYLKDQFLPNSEVISTTEEAKEFSDNLFPKLSLLFHALGFETSYGILDDYSPILTTDQFSTLSRTFTILYQLSDEVSVGATFIVSPEDHGGHGLVITPFGDWNFLIQVKKWLFNSSLSASIEGFSVNADGVTFPDDFSDTNLSFSSIIGKADTEEGKQFQIGSTNGTRLEIDKVSFEVLGNFDNANLEYGANIILENLALYLGGGDGDGFINKILPNPLSFSFDLLAGWTNKKGFYMEGSGAGPLELSIPINKEIFGIFFETINISLQKGDSGFQINLDANFGFSLGPFSANVSNLGLTSNIDFVKGNLGFLDASLGFKPPTGLGIAIDSSTVKGGGYLYFNTNEEKYFGVLELNIKNKIALTAIGILTTKLPNNPEGYSLLLLITAEFSPITLGFGFTLNGVGGLVALNRTMNLQAIRDGVKSNSLDNVLFPENPIENIKQIITDLETIFPVEEGRYVFGIMGLIGWGTPTLITMEIGLMLEVPSPVRLAILGVIKAILPTESDDLLRIQINFAGIIDFEAKYITFDASIFDSKLLTFTLAGDMAFRLKWGDESNFLISVGGFHPSYTPPPLDLPSMDRLTINLLGSDNPRLTLSAYFALTSNTVQFGSLIDFYMKITNNIKVIGNLGFDILIQFSPFYLKAEIYAMLAVLRKGKALLSISLYGSIEGPAPWHVIGSAEFKILGISLDANFDKTFGEEEENIYLEDIDVLTKVLIPETDDYRNWEGEFPPASTLSVNLKDNKDVLSNEILAHPSGNLRFSQKKVPLGLTLAKYGKQNPLIYNHFTLEFVNLDDNSQTNTKELFAPAEFISLTDSQKLSRKSFEKMKSGVRSTASDKYKSTYFIQKDVVYDHSVIDSREELTPDTPIYSKGNYAENDLLFATFSANNAVGNSSLGKGTKPPSNFKPSKINNTQESFAIADLTDLSIHTDNSGVDMTFSSQTEAKIALVELHEKNPELINEIDVVSTFELV